MANAGRNQSICFGSGKVMIGDTAVSGNTYSWASNPSGFNDTTPNPMVTPSVTTTYYMTETITATKCNKTDSVIITVNPLPMAKTGNNQAICFGGSTSMGDTAIIGNTYFWTSNPEGFYDIIANTVVNPASTTTYYLTETTPATGCNKSDSVIIAVNPLPAAISGPSSVCVGQTITLTDGGAGTWSKSNTNANIGSVSGVVTGVIAGADIITYTLPITGCYITRTVTVSTSAGGIGGTPYVCVGSTTILTDAGGGIWSSGSGTISIGSSSGSVTGITAGTAIVTYSIGTGCSSNTIVTINPLPATISGAGSICPGGGIALSGPAGGVWSSTGASIGSLSGVVTGTIAGIPTITYTLPTGCIRTTTITINPTPPLPGGPSALCVGAHITLTESGSGTWLSGSGGIAAIGATTGTVTGIATGTSNITFTSAAGCSITTTITVSISPTAITGPGTVCAGAGVSLADTAGGGVWITGSGAAIIGSLSGVVTGISAGTAIITYSLGTGCTVTRTETVIASPAAILGAATLCAGSTALLTETTTGGVWSSTPTSVATITTSGVVSGVATGTAVIDYTAGGCFASDTITVNTAPTTIGGPASVCLGSSITATDAVTGGVWSTGGSAAGIGSTGGVVTGLSAATAIITYSIGTCSINRTITVNPATSITGTSSLCVGTSATLAGIGIGIWSGGGSVAIIGSSSGLVTGTGTGISIITYTLPTGCSATYPMTVNATPSIIGGLATVCQGASVTATDAVAGGTWSTTSTNITIGSTGNITGVTAGTAIITYSIGSCSVNRTITVNPIAAIMGATGLCVGNTTTLSDATTGGRWSCSGAVAVGSTGVVTGLSAGAANVTYTTALGCSATYSVTVNTTPSAIGGLLNVCIGGATNLTNTAGGGAWTTTSSNISIGSSSGVVMGIAAGTAPVVYSLGSGCTVSAVVTVNLPPAAITGTMNVCPGLTIDLLDLTIGGAWTIGSTAHATIDARGVVTGLSAGTATISYTSLAGCVVTATVTVIPPPDAITGTLSVCEGATTILSDTSPGGIWSTVSTHAAIDGSTGVVTGIVAGTALITYTLPSGCAIAASVYVNAAPTPITGITAMCVGSATTLSDSSPGGMWSVAVGSALSVGSASGVVTGLSLGTEAVSYTLSGCSVVTTVSVNSLPGSIAGSAHLCVGITDTLTDAGGGIWSSSNSLIAVVGSGTGAVTGVIPGTVSVSYSLGIGCTVSRPFTVNPTPASITGPSVLCAGSTVTLHDVTAGGAWSSGNTILATINAFGIVSGLSGGTVVLSYTSVATGCASAYPVAVIQVPPITEAHNICAWGDTVTVHDSLAGGSFTSTLVTVSDSGAVLSYAPGTAVITYTEIHGCFATTTITVNPLPGEITGSRDICIGATVALGDTSVGGVWSISPTLAGSISTSGAVTGMAIGEVAVTYTTSRYGCRQTMAITVDAAPSSAGTIVGADNVCAGSSIVLLNTTTGGIWSATGGVAGIGSVTGVVTATTAGIATIHYTVTDHCGSIAATATVTVNADVTPTISISATTDTLCVGAMAHFTSVITNGGAAPAYQWQVNGIATLMSSSYSYIPANGDVVTATLTSNAACAVPASVMSNTVTMVLDPEVVPVVVITATPAGPILVGGTKTFTATVTTGGAAPTYQWLLNGTAIPGATGASYTANNFNNGDSVYCLVTSSGKCGGNTATSNGAGVIVFNNVGVPFGGLTMTDIEVIPNPSRGTFTIKGTVGSIDEDVHIVITDMLGQEVYRTAATARNGVLNEPVRLAASVANGMYLVNVITNAGSRVFHVVIEQ